MRGGGGNVKVDNESVRGVASAGKLVLFHPLHDSPSHASSHPPARRPTLSVWRRLSTTIYLKPCPATLTTFTTAVWWRCVRCLAWLIVLGYQPKPVFTVNLRFFNPYYSRQLTNSYGKCLHTLRCAYRVYSCRDIGVLHA